MSTYPDLPGASAANPENAALFKRIVEAYDDSNYTQVAEAFDVSLKRLAETARHAPFDTSRSSLQTGVLDIMIEDVISKFTRSVSLVNVELAANDALMICDLEKDGVVALELEVSRDSYLSDIALILVNTVEAFETTPMDDDTRKSNKEIAEAAVKRIYAEAVNAEMPHKAAMDQLLIGFGNQIEASLQNIAFVTPDYLDMRMQSLDSFSDTQSTLKTVIAEYIEAKNSGCASDSIPELKFQSAMQRVVIAFKACVDSIEYEPGESRQSRTNSIAALMLNEQEAHRSLAPTCVFEDDKYTLETAGELITAEYKNATEDHKTAPLTDEQKAEDTVERICRLFMRGYTNDLDQVLKHLI